MRHHARGRVAVVPGGVNRSMTKAEGMGRKQTVGRGLRAVCVAVAFLCTTGPARAVEAPRSHGFKIDDEHRLDLRQVKGDVEIAIVNRTRLPGGESVKFENAELWRASTREILAKVHSEVLKPAAPNYLNNRGERYRIRVQGVTVEPRYVSQKDVDAADARVYLYGELDKLRVRASGIQREALRLGSGVCLAVLNKAGYLPADVPLSELKSKALKSRMQDKTMRHQTIRKTKGFNVYQNEENYAAETPRAGGPEAPESESSPE